MEVEGGAFWAWGILVYKEPLTVEEMDDYELRPKRENPDIWPLMLRETAHVGEWESRNNIPKERRVTYWKERTHCYLPRLGVTPERMEEQYWLAMKYPKGPCHHRQKTPAPHFGER